MDKTELLATLDGAHDGLRATIDALSDHELALPAQGDWTRRDLVAHIEWWERHSAQVLRALLAGHEPYSSSEPFDLAAHNARVFDARRGRTAADVRRGEAEAWTDLAGLLESAGEADLFAADRFAWTGGTPLVETIRDDTDRHWAEHLPHFGGPVAPGGSPSGS